MKMKFNFHLRGDNIMKEKIDNYCVDCKGWTKQTYHHTNNVDGDLIYICNECGCENSVYEADLRSDKEKE